MPITIDIEKHLAMNIIEHAIQSLDRSAKRATNVEVQNILNKDITTLKTALQKLKNT